MTIFIYKFYRLKKAFDSIIRDKLWNILKRYGIPDIYVNSSEIYMMEVLAALFETEKELTDSKFQTRGRQ